MKGDVVTFPFPFSDLSGQKLRPALIISTLTGDDVITCMITSKEKFDQYSIGLLNSDFKEGSLNQDCHIRPNRIFTADSNIVVKRKGRICVDKVNEVIKKLIAIIGSN